MWWFGLHHKDQTRREYLSYQNLYILYIMFFVIYIKWIIGALLFKMPTAARTPPNNKTSMSKTIVLHVRFFPVVCQYAMSNDQISSSTEDVSTQRRMFYFLC